MQIIVGILSFLIVIAVFANMSNMFTAIIIIACILALPVVFYIVIYSIALFRIIFGKKK